MAFRPSTKVTLVLAAAVLAGNTCTAGAQVRPLAAPTPATPPTVMAPPAASQPTASRPAGSQVKIPPDTLRRTFTSLLGQARTAEAARTVGSLRSAQQHYVKAQQMIELYPELQVDADTRETIAQRLSQIPGELEKVREAANAEAARIRAEKRQDRAIAEEKRRYEQQRQDQLRREEEARRRYIYRGRY